MWQSVLKFYYLNPDDPPKIDNNNPAFTISCPKIDGQNDLNISN